MSAQVIDGKAISALVRQDLQGNITRLKALGVTPGLAVVLVGDDPASRVYVNMKKKACAALGMYSEEHLLSADISQDELIDTIKALNADPKIHGILVQLPIPAHLDEDEVIETILPSKDVDGFHPINVGRLMIGKPTFVPCTPAGIIKLIKSTGVDIRGKNAAVVGRSNIVGKPAATLLLQEHATVTICHSRTRDLAAHCRNADILVVAVGRQEIIRGDMIKPGAIVIDVGTNKVEGRLLGDVAFEEAKETAGFITPVPGGVGPMTIAMLMTNTVRAAEMKSEKN
jgi:methylenetetrahydrofolate dehydrogenase (NADP+)/methenyltetrahydrofolate cyclohydrolase